MSDRDDDRDDEEDVDDSYAGDDRANVHERLDALELLVEELREEIRGPARQALERESGGRVALCTSRVDGLEAVADHFRRTLEAIAPGALATHAAKVDPNDA